MTALPRLRGREAQATFDAERTRLLAMLENGASLRDALEALVRWVESHGDGRMLTSVLLMEDGQRLRHGAAPSLPDVYNAAIDGIGVGPSVGSCGTAAYCGHAIFVVDVATDPLWKDFKDLAMKHGLRACWSAPIMVPPKQVLGTFAMYYRQVQSPDDEDRTIIGLASKVAAAVIVRARELGRA